MPARTLMSCRRALRSWTSAPVSWAMLFIGRTMTRAGLGLGGLGQSIADRAVNRLWIVAEKNRLRGLS